jgi:hypothetical protein
MLHLSSLKSLSYLDGSSTRSGTILYQLYGPTLKSHATPHSSPKNIPTHNNKPPPTIELGNSSWIIKVTLQHCLLTFHEST